MNACVLITKTQQYFYYNFCPGSHNYKVLSTTTPQTITMSFIFSSKIFKASCLHLNIEFISDLICNSNLSCSPLGSGGGEVCKLTVIQLVNFFEQRCSLKSEDNEISSAYCIVNKHVLKSIKWHGSIHNYYQIQLQNVTGVRPGNARAENFFHDLEE